MIITFLPSEKIHYTEYTDNLLDAAQKAGLLMDTSCAGRGTCGKCKVKILDGKPDRPDSVEKKHLTEKELEQGWRLACRMLITCDMTIEVPSHDMLNGNKQDMIQLPHGFLHGRDIPAQVSYGIAFDIGTTTVVGMLWDLKKGALINAAARTNPQSSYGADVISRILFCMEQQGNLDIMQQLILSCMNDIIDELIINSGIERHEIGKSTVVGNTTMSHLLLAIDPASLAMAPFSPGFYGPVDKKALELGLNIGSDSDIHVLPNIAGHVGSDIVGVLLASELADKKGVNLAVDIGTNGEILLSNKGRVLTCSTAAGPAFEGASIYQGMRASKGAIDGIRINEGKVELSIIGSDIPKGICGSGLIQCVAEMLNYGLITENGKLLNQEEARNKGLNDNILKHLRSRDNGREFILFDGNGLEDDVVLTQKDIREVQLAKAAISAGIKILMKELGVGPGLDRILLAGAFGNHIDKDSALRIGLLPSVSKEKVISIGNAAGTGSSMALLSESHLKSSYHLADKTEHIELAGHSDFQEAYMKEMYFTD